MTAVLVRPSFGPVRIVAAVALVLLLVTMVFPQIDLAVAGLTYVPAQGFPLAHLPFFVFVMKALPDVAIGATVGAAILGIVASLRGRTLAGVTPRIALFLVSSLALGPGLVVNTILKDHWGRARPHQIVEFGGAAHFSPAVLLADQCTRNCSFPSGHAALGFWLVAFAMVLPPRWRRIGMTIAVGIGVLVGAMRIAQGAHFLSDVIAAAIIVIGINYLLARLIFGPAVVPPN